MTTQPHEPVTFGQTPLRIEDVLALANRQVPTRLQDDAEYRERIAKGARFLDSLLDKEGVIYGVTTGYGDSCVVAAPPSAIAIGIQNISPYLRSYTTASTPCCHNAPRPACGFAPPRMPI